MKITRHIVAYMPEPRLCKSTYQLKKFFILFPEMDPSKDRKGEKESSGGNNSSKDKSSSRTERSNWSVMAVKAKVTDKCLWSVCKAMTAGFLFILVGAGMATLGFYSDHLSTVEHTKGNTTVWVKNESKDSHLGSLTYLGPIVMGVGGFIIVAACVMTFEARDTAAKIVPIWFRRTRIHVVSGGSNSTASGRSSKASWERFLGQRSSEDAADTRSAVTQALVNFSKYLQNSIDTNKMSQNNPYVSNQQVPGLRKCPSEPNLGKALRDANGNNLPESVALLEASTPQPSQRTTYGGGLKPICRSTKPQLLSVAPDTYRQTVSMDCPRLGRLNGENEKTEAEETNDTKLQKSDRIKIQTLPLQTSCTTSSSGSMSVDIYLPQGAVTLKIHDDKKENKNSVNLGSSQESRSFQLSVQSDMQSFVDDDEFSNILDDNVFTNPDSSLCTPQIVLNTVEPSSDRENTNVASDNLTSLSNMITTSVEEWSNYPPQFIPVENKSDSLEIHSTTDSPQSLSLSNQFSFECSERDSAGDSLASVISNPFSSRLTDQRSRSLSQTDTSFVNVSSLGSMESSQDNISPLVFSGSPQYFDYNPDFYPSDPPNRKNNPGSSNEEVNRTFQKHSRSFGDSSHEQGLRNNEGGNKINPQKHSSLESAEIKMSKTKQHASRSPKRQQRSFEGSEKVVQDPFLLPSPRYLSPGAVSGLSSSTTHSPTVLTFSPRKTRSESLPERRQAASLKRFPLLRQVALDAFAEEGGSTHRLNRSQTQISSKEASSPEI